ncbi:hypothetical protein BDB00DRAFT_839199 [Zychaea mexicana]|uniref:uncharacterized protein n=1 Tax=Zychaea mexicana TaxID=64656 RepID=UPI0022FE70A7|nr:uncharacterized protein BDB00DRAFT_839199 [Zychaea mexicana]KAI9490142.1 hypothetical protein BDB00DRAFT_839199 [Zychaea mexicana]
MASVIVTFSCLVARLSNSNNNNSQQYKHLKNLDQLVTYGQRLYLEGEYEEAYRLFFRLEQCQPHIKTTCRRYQVQCLTELAYYTRALATLESFISPRAASGSKATHKSASSHSPCSLDWYILGSDICFAQGNYAAAIEWLRRGCQQMAPNDDTVQEAITLRERLALEKLARSTKGSLTTTQHQRRGVGHCSNISENSRRRRLQQDSMQPQRQLQRQKEREQSTIRIDFVEMLPYDVTSAIFQIMSFECIVQCTWVSRRWHTYLIESVHLWQDLEFSYNEMPVEPGSLCLYLSRLNGAPLKRIKIHHECVDGDGLLGTLLNHTSLRLQELDLSEVVCTPSLFYDLLAHVGPSLRVLRWRGLILKLGKIIDCVAESCVQLKHLEVRSCFVSDTPFDSETRSSSLLDHSSGYFPRSFFDKISALKPLSIDTLDLGGIHELTMVQLARILHRSPKIVNLTLENCILDIVSVANVLFHSCPLLQRLRYSRHRYAQQHEAEGGEDDVGNSSNMMSWSLASSTSITTAGGRGARHLPLTAMARKHVGKASSVVGKRSWREITLAKAQTTTDAVIQRFIGQSDLTRLERLDLTGNTNLSDKALQGVFTLTKNTNLMHLRTLCLGGCTGFTEQQTLLNILKAGPMLTHIDVAESPAVTDMVLDQITDGSNAALHTVCIAGCRSITDAAVRRLVDVRRDTLVKLDANRASISVETSGYIMCKLKLSI